MAFINTISPREALGETRSMYLAQQKSYGYVPNYAKIFCYRPEVMSLWADLQRGIRQNLSDKEFELATLAAALESGSTNCALAHGTRLSTYYTNKELKAIVRDLRNNTPCDIKNGVLTTAELTMMSFARKITCDAASITQTDVTEVKDAGYIDAQVFDIAATAAARSFFTKIIDSLGSATDHSYPQMDHELRNMLSAGRPPVTSSSEFCHPDLSAPHIKECL